MLLHVPCRRCCRPAVGHEDRPCPSGLQVFPVHLDGDGDRGRLVLVQVVVPHVGVASHHGLLQEGLVLERKQSRNKHI